MKTPVHKNGDWMLCSSGAQFWPLDPDPEDVYIEDIAHALANLCRFGGHCREFYSVAQHSLLVAQILPKPLKLQGLLHDATEAYVGDMVRPLKRFMPAYQEVEQKLWLCIAERFGLPAQLDPEVKKADDIILMTEKRDVMIPSPHPWGLEGIVEPAAGKIDILSPKQAENAFLDLFLGLTARFYTT